MRTALAIFCLTAACGRGTARSVQDISMLPPPAFVRTDAEVDTGSEEAVDNQGTVWMLEARLVPIMNDNMFVVVSTGNLAARDALARAFAALPMPPVDCDAIPGRSLSRVEAAGVETVWRVCVGPDGVVTEPYATALRAFP